MKTSFLLASLLALAVLTLIPAIVRADGMFVPQKFVWDKHKDINEPTQKAILIYDAGHEDLILQVKYEGPVDQFGWLIPVPALPTVQNGSMRCFYELSKLTQQRSMDMHANVMSAGIGDESAQAKPQVKVIEIKTVGAYEIAVLSANDSGALKKWLGANQFVLPPDPSGVIDSYIQRHWDFVAVKINLDPSLFSSGTAAASRKLASGELNPLQISFASEHCVFPLRISSPNGKPSEVSLYVLAADPLLCQAQFERDNVITYSNDMARGEAWAQRMERDNATSQARIDAMRKQRGLPPAPPRMDDYQKETMQRLRENPQIEPDEELQFTKAASSDLRDCRKMVPRLAGKSWWIAKKTWTFQPADMQDLAFGPALPVLAETLGSKYGYIAVADFQKIGTDSIPVLITVLNSPNHLARANAANVLQGFGNDPRVQAAAPAWLKNSDSKVRVMAIYTLANYPNVQPGHIERFIPLLSDEDAGVRDAVVSVISLDRDDLPKYAPLFQKMLTDTNPAVRATGLRLAFSSGVTMDRSEWLSFLSVPDKRVLGIVATHLRWADRQYDLSDDEAIPLLQNPEPLGRLIGLTVLSQHGDAHAIALARPLLNDTNATVRAIAQRDLQKMTGQDAVQ